MINFDRFPGGRFKALTMSYDDGVVQDRRLVEIFNKYGIVGTFHVNAGSFGKGNRLSIDEISSLYSRHEISAHGYTHQPLGTTPKERIVNEIVNDRKTLEKYAGYIIRGMSYPNGSLNDEVVKMLPYLGMEYSRKVQTTQGFGLPSDFLRWEATCHHRQNLIELGRKFLEAQYRRNPMLMYVWGHSYEFDNDNNWDLIEEFCKMAGGHEDIWYATNIQIVDYLNAVKGLRFSADEKMVFNPSCISVWITVDTDAIEIKPGQTLSL